MKFSGRWDSRLSEKAASDKGLKSSDQNYLATFKNYSDDLWVWTPKGVSIETAGRTLSRNISADADIFVFSDADNEERLSDMLSDSGLSVGTETDECAESANPFPEGYKRPENTNK